MQFLVILQEFCPLLLGILITLSKIPANLRFIRDKALNACEELVSFDVVSLFTEIPVYLAVQVAVQRLREDASLVQRTSLPLEDIIHLLSFASKPRNLHITAPSINIFLVELWVCPSLLSLPTW